MNNHTFKQPKALAEAFLKSSVEVRSKHLVKKTFKGECNTLIQAILPS